MRFSRTLKTTLALGATAGLMTLGLGSASAHVSATPTDTAVGSYSLFTFSVPHGCDGSSTTSIRITLPEELNAVTPTVNPNWTISESIEKFTTPRQLADGSKITQRTSAVTYTAKTPLDAHQRDSFTLSLKVPDAAGKTLYFPTLQTCEKGSTDWKDIPAAGQDHDSVKSPAPSLAVTAAVATTEHGHGDSTATPAAASSDMNDAAAPTWPSWLGLGTGLAGLVMGAIAFMRSGRTKA
ncbi:nuclear export factor GLE1 (plasmid) [Arthrobacter sp. ERGS1:01]|uniref:YcnI family copper-binding membrane protein n=1 Tax=Arthrobacter sp. ERGS1:01 TaxID=1704044 RepID=UPI0006B61714|nr:YcnI family protein [Arthrobacter sp. ERGS1:01]ALE04516.1 nuclear export factor GLE1 [Arthrobacter sp. ERGS1:01]